MNINTSINYQEEQGHQDEKLQEKEEGGNEKEH